MGAYAFATIHEIHYTESMSAVIQEVFDSNSLAL